MKKKILIPAIIALAIGGILLYNAMDQDQNNKVNPKTYKEYNFTTNLGFSESSITKNEISLTKEQELSELFGTPVTNNLGIADVYLNIIHETIPESHVEAKKAAVKMFYYDSQALQALKNKDYNSFLINTYRWSAGMSCLFLNERDNKIRNKLFKEEKLLDESIKNLRKLNRQSDNNLGGHIIYDDFGFKYQDNNYIDVNSGYSESELCKKYMNMEGYFI